MLTPTAQKKKIPFNIVQLIDNTPGHSRALKEMDNEVNVFMPTNTTSILQPMNQGVTSTFKCSFLTNTFCQSMAVMDRDSSFGSRQSKLKIFWRGFTIVDAIKNIHALRQPRGVGWGERWEGDLRKRRYMYTYG